MKGTLADVFVTVLCLSMFSTFTLKVIAQQSAGDWSMFLNNPAHTGATTNTGPEQPAKALELHRRTFDGSAIGSSAAIVNGVVYVGSNWNNGAYPLPNINDSGSIYAFNAQTGAKIWNTSTMNAVIFVSRCIWKRIIYRCRQQCLRL